ncbi:unnamed protein product [Schistosoma curassoni]|uniref:LIM zinc-binding domain-containing protein n=1 Tax=Schistosoma curassoni TaxID=6186 RepID=A0A183L2P6_9TREM|nr:unnamed protein product [Schistosoma curassoni]
MSTCCYYIYIYYQVIRRGGVTYKGNPWHKECFTCTSCSKQLAGLKFTSKDEQPYCADCYGELFAKKCTKCTKPITGYWSSRTPLVWTEGFLAPLDGSSISTKLVKASDNHFSSSQFRKQQ